MAEFIDAAHELWQASPSEISSEDFELVFDLIQQRLPALHSKSVVDLDNIESVFSVIEMGRLVGRLPMTKQEEIERAAIAIRRVLAQTVESYCQFPTDEEGGIEPHKQFRRIAERIASGQVGSRTQPWSFITFNYDLSLDFALHWTNHQIDYALETKATAGIPLLKLHGSLNWAGCPVCGVIRPLSFERLFSRLPTGRRSKSTARSLPATRHLDALGPHCPEAVPQREPALVPPSWNKTQYHAAFGNVWRRAAQEIAAAEEIVIVGYSMPQSDAFFRDLLALGLAGPARLKHFVVINPDPKVGGRIQGLLGPAVGNRFRAYTSTFDEWVDSRFR